MTSKYTEYDQLSKLSALALVSTYIFMIHVFTYKEKIYSLHLAFDDMLSRSEVDGIYDAREI